MPRWLPLPGRRERYIDSSPDSVCYYTFNRPYGPCTTRTRAAQRTGWTGSCAQATQLILLVMPRLQPTFNLLQHIAVRHTTDTPVHTVLQLAAWIHLPPLPYPPRLPGSAPAIALNRPSYVRTARSRTWPDFAVLVTTPHDLLHTCLRFGWDWLPRLTPLPTLLLGSGLMRLPRVAAVADGQRVVYCLASRTVLDTRV